MSNRQLVRRLSPTAEVIENDIKAALEGQNEKELAHVYEESVKDFEIDSILKGRILNRERINKTIEGVYFICAECKKVCHNMDEGLVEDPDNVHNVCGACAKTKSKGKQAAA